MKVKKILCSILALCMILSTMGTVAFSADASPVAKVDDTEFTKIEDAVEAWTNGKTLTLLDNVTLSDVIQLNSTEHHILDLGQYVMTAATGNHAIEILPKGVGTASKNCLTINADSDNPGGITATGKSCIYYTNANKIADRLTVTINGGVFEGSYAINSASGPRNRLNITTDPIRGQSAPYFVLNGGTFNAPVLINAGMLKMTGGTYNKSFTCNGDSTAYRLISGGKFKSLPTLTHDEEGKLIFGTEKTFEDEACKIPNGKYNADIYIDDDGYFVVDCSAVSEKPGNYEASSVNAYKAMFQYSAIKDDGVIYCTSAEYAMNNLNDVKLFVPYDKNKTVKSGSTFTVDTTENTFTGNVTITKTGVFVIKYNADNPYEGTVENDTGKYGVKITETVEGDIVTKTYTGYEIIDETNATLRVEYDDNIEYFKDFGKAFESCNGTSGKTIVLMANISNPFINANTSTTETNVTIDLNGYKVSGYLNGNKAKTPSIVNIIDSSAGKTGSVPSTNFLSRLTNNNYTGVVKGGTWPADPSAYVSEGFMSVPNDDGTYTVKIMPAKIVDTYYKTLEDAVNAAKEGDNIEILDAQEGELSEITKTSDKSFELGETEVITTDIDEGIEVTVPTLIDHVLESYDGKQGTYEVVVEHKNTAYDETAATLDLDISLKYTYDGVTEDVDAAGKTFTVKVKLPGNAKLSPTPTVKHNGTEISGVKVVDGYVVFETTGFSPYTIDYQLTGIAAPTEMCKEAVVEFVVSEKNENNTVYDIVIKSTDNTKPIFGLVSAQMDIKEASDMSGVNFLVEGANDFIVTNDADSYMFTLKSADNQALADTKSGESVKIGKLTISGFTTDPIEWTVGTYTVNSVINTDDGAATSYLDTTVTTNETKNIDIKLTGGSVTYEKDVPKQELTVEVTFPKTITENDYKYQDMKITVTEQDYGTVEVFNLGTGGKATITDDKYVVSKDLPKYKTYTVKIEGAGYRTFTKTVDLDADKTMIVWNNYKDNGALIIKDGETEPEAKATITFLAGDIVKDNTVNAYDLSVLLSYAFTDGIVTTAVSKYTQYDLNRDGLINYKDAAMILDTWVWGK